MPQPPTTLTTNANRHKLLLTRQEGHGTQGGCYQVLHVRGQQLEAMHLDVQVSNNWKLRITSNVHGHGGQLLHVHDRDVYCISNSCKRLCCVNCGHRP